MNNEYYSETVEEAYVLLRKIPHEIENAAVNIYLASIQKDTIYQQLELIESILEKSMMEEMEDGNIRDLISLMDEIEFVIDIFRKQKLKK